MWLYLECIFIFGVVASTQADYLCDCGDGPDVSCLVQGNLTLNKVNYEFGEDELIAMCTLRDDNSQCRFTSTKLCLNITGVDPNSIEKEEENVSTAVFRYNKLKREDNGADIFCFLEGYYTTEKGGGNRKLATLNQTTLKVGVRPVTPHSIDCTVYNLQTMRCSFLPESQDTGFNTEQKIYFRRGTGLSEEAEGKLPCQHQVNNECFWKDIHDSNMDADEYRRHYQYAISVIASNVLGESKTSKVFQSKDILVLNPVKHLEVTHVEQTAFNIKWKKPLEDHVDQLIIYQVLVNSQWTNVSVAEKNVTTEGADMNTTFTGLTPFTRYNVSIRCITQHLANKTRSRYWSEIQHIIITTDPDVPGSAPAVTPGGYTFLDNKEVEIYWQPIPLSELHGEWDVTRIQVFPRSTDEQPSCLGSSAILNERNPKKYSKRLELLHNHTYDICVDVQNQIGLNDSLVLQPIRIPPNELQYPTFYAVGSDTTITVKLLETELAISYTLFSCKSHTMSTCNQWFHWRRMDTNRSISHVNTVHHETALIGMSAEYVNPAGFTVSSGIKKAPHIFQYGNDIQKPSRLDAVKNVAHHKSLLVEWTKPQWDSTAYIGYFNLSYCQKDLCDNPDVVQPEEIMIPVNGLLDGKNQTFKLGNLTEERTYVLKMRSIGDDEYSGYTEPFVVYLDETGLSRMEIIFLSIGLVVAFAFVVAGIYQIGQICKKKCRDYQTPMEIVELPTDLADVYHERNGNMTSKSDPYTIMDSIPMNSSTPSQVSDANMDSANPISQNFANGELERRKAEDQTPENVALLNGGKHLLQNGNGDAHRAESHVVLLRNKSMK